MVGGGRIINKEGKEVVKSQYWNDTSLDIGGGIAQSDRMYAVN